MSIGAGRPSMKQFSEAGSSRRGWARPRGRAGGRHRPGRLAVGQSVGTEQEKDARCAGHWASAHLASQSQACGPPGSAPSYPAREAPGQPTLSALLKGKATQVLGLRSPRTLARPPGIRLADTATPPLSAGHCLCAVVCPLTPSPKSLPRLSGSRAPPGTCSEWTLEGRGPQQRPLTVC